ncbi:MAG: zinc ABC transporter solute-binding protein [Phycisphaerales bacterium]|nr:zinc ABC transporter solute-binding protein [Phycisphaerales bacterium]NNM26890.1 zinc ABC transporter solute-binding protein [Phycisphaerales bacterium]
MIGWRRFAAAAGLMLLGACGRTTPAPTAATPDRPMVVVSVAPLAYFVERLAEDRVAIEVMIPPGANPATYEPTMTQMRSVTRATIYVKVGHPSFPFEAAWLDRLLGPAAGVTVVDATAGAPHRRGDPHVWLSPAAARVMIDNLADALATVLPHDSAALDANRVTLLAEIADLEATLHQVLDPHRGRSIVVFHPAWGYLTEAYGLTQAAIEHNHQEPDAHTLAELIAHARASDTKVIFVQPQFATASAEMVARAVNARVVAIDPLARDWDANLRRVARAWAESFEP